MWVVRRKSKVTHSYVYYTREFQFFLLLSGLKNSSQNT